MLFRSCPGGPTKRKTLLVSFAPAARERRTLLVFVGSGALAYEHEAGVRVAVGEDDLVSTLSGQWAASAVADVGTDGLKRGGAVGNWGGGGGGCEGGCGG